MHGVIGLPVFAPGLMVSHGTRMASGKCEKMVVPSLLLCSQKVSSFYRLGTTKQEHYRQKRGKQMQKQVFWSALNHFDGWGLVLAGAIQQLGALPSASEPRQGSRP